MDYIMPVVIWCFVIALCIGILRFLLRIMFHYKNHSGSWYDCPKCLSHEPAPELQSVKPKHQTEIKFVEDKIEVTTRFSAEIIKIEKQSTPWLWGITTLFVIALIICVVIVGGMKSPGEKILTMDGYVVDRYQDQYGGQYYLVVHFGDPWNANLSIPVSYDTWLSDGYGVSYTIQIYVHSFHIENTTA